MSSKISALTALAAGSVDTTADLLPIVDTSATTTKSITPSAFLLENTFSETWNNAGTTFKGLTIDITDTASNAASAYLDIKRSGTSIFQVTDNGGFALIQFGNAPELRCGNASSISVGGPSANVYLGDSNTFGGNVRIDGGSNLIKMQVATQLCWSQDATSYGTKGVQISVGSGTPEGAVTAVVGSLFLRTDGGATTTLYVKTSGTGNTGWTAK